MKKYCPKCNVYTKQSYCPLCQFKLADESEDSTYYPVYETKPYRRGFIQRLVLFIATFAVSTSLLINLLTEAHQLWLLYILGPALYGVILINYTILSKTHTCSNYVFLFIVLLLMLIYFVFVLCFVV